MSGYMDSDGYHGNVSEEAQMYAARRALSLLPVEDRELAGHMLETIYEVGSSEDPLCTGAIIFGQHLLNVLNYAMHAIATDLPAEDPMTFGFRRAWVIIQALCTTYAIDPTHLEAIRLHGQADG